MNTRAFVLAHSHTRTAHTPVMPVVQSDLEPSVEFTQDQALYLCSYLRA